MEAAGKTNEAKYAIKELFESADIESEWSWEQAVGGSTNLYEQAKTVADSSSKLLRTDLSEVMESTREDNLSKAIVCPQDCRAAVSCKRARFSLKPTTSRLELCGGMNLNTDQLQDPRSPISSISLLAKCLDVDRPGSRSLFPEIDDISMITEHIPGEYNNINISFTKDSARSFDGVDESSRHASGLDDMEANKGMAVARKTNITHVEVETADEEQLVFSTKQEEKNAFKELLESANAESNWSWQARGMIISDKRYGALKTFGESKQAFNEFLSQRKKQMAEETLVKQKLACEEFTKMLEESKELTSSMTWSKALPMFEDDERFKAVECPKDREDLFKNYLLELQKKVLHGTINLYVELEDRVILAVDSRCTTEIEEQGRTMMMWDSDDNMKYKELIRANWLRSSVVITAAGSRSRNISLWEYLERVQHKKKHDIDTLPHEIIKWLTDTPRRDTSQKCKLYIAGYSNRSKSFVVKYIEDGFKNPKTCVSKYGAIGSGAKIALNRLKNWADEMKRAKWMDSEKVYQETIQYIQQALLECTIFDPACGGYLRVIEIKRTICTPGGHHPLELMAYFQPRFDHNALFFFSRDAYSVMNYDRLDRCLVAQEWLKECKDAEGKATRYMVGCLGEVGDAHLFLVNFGSKKDKLKKNAKEFFAKCGEFKNTDDQVRYFDCEGNFLSVCQLSYTLLNAIVNGTYSLPWRD